MLFSISLRSAVLDSTWVKSCDVHLSGFDLLHLTWFLPGSSMFSLMMGFHYSLLVMDIPLCICNSFSLCIDLCVVWFNLPPDSFEWGFSRQGSSHTEEVFNPWLTHSFFCCCSSVNMCKQSLRCLIIIHSWANLFLIVGLGFQLTWWLAG